MTEILDLLENALSKATGMNDAGESDREIHWNRSQNLVDQIARGFQKQFEANPAVRVFWSGNTANQTEFNRKEFLFDIAVCEVEETPSATGRALLHFVTKTHWIVESEFEPNSRDAIVDMSKLVMGKSENVLFIGSAVAPKDAYLDMLGRVARHCDGHTYLALIEHPGKWKTQTPRPEVYSWAGEKWSRMGPSARQ